MEKYIHRELGQPGLARARKLLGRGDKGYGFDQSLPDDELIRMVRVITEASGKGVSEVLVELAEGMVPGLLEVYRFLVNPR